MILVIVIVVLVLLVLFLMSSYNKLVRLSNKVDEGFSTMDVYLKKRFDLIPIPPLSSRCWSAPPAFPCCRASLWPSLRPEEICAFWRCQTSG